MRECVLAVLALALFLGVFSLPNDIQNRTIFTIVTKPVRPLEIVLGRILGFGAIGTLLLQTWFGWRLWARRFAGHARPLSCCS